MIATLRVILVAGLLWWLELFIPLPIIPWYLLLLLVTLSHLPPGVALSLAVLLGGIAEAIHVREPGSLISVSLAVVVLARLVRQYLIADTWKTRLPLVMVVTCFAIWLETFLYHPPSATIAGLFGSAHRVFPWVCTLLAAIGLADSFDEWVRRPLVRRARGLL
ncbi:MAG: hypothetical protein HYV02_00395 [Deltaproteobacteria bacterium]|nr:hypothetical protein [Deltaproteobacteria bacterium]